jgi:3-oxoacyl-[acyl-carrier protein] reductase
MAISISFEKKIALVTGGASGLGKNIALKLAKTGCKGIAISDINEERSQAVIKEIQSLGSEGLFVKSDACKENDVKNVVETIVDKWGTLDMLVNNVGVCYRGNIWDETEEQFLKTLNINLLSTFLFTKYVSQVMIEKKRGSIVSIASTAGITGGTMGPSYAASKGGIISLNKHAARTLAKYGIRVNVVAPGYMKTEMLSSVFKDKKQREERWSAIPMGRIAEPEEIANAVIFLLSEEASYITGDVMLASGGRTS